MSEAERQKERVRLRLSQQAERYVRRDAPVESRHMAAGGALPLPPVELVTVLFALLHDPDQGVKDRARKSLEELPKALCESVLASEASQAPVLAYLAHAFKDDSARMELLALNPACDDRTVCFLATLPHRRVVDIVANNQQRMLRNPDIVDALGDNPLTGRATIDRILSFLGLERPAAEVLESDLDGEDLPPPPEITDEDALSALQKLLGDDASEFSRELLADTDGELDPEEEGSLLAMISKMSVMQRVKLARMGNKESRSILIRDRNKIVASAAIRSPKITDNEVEGIAKARNVPDEVLRVVASNRDWTRSYQVKLGLATNPKCPIPTALKFLNYLQERDLRNIMKSKDVATPVSTHARRLLQKKGKI